MKDRTWVFHSPTFESEALYDDLHMPWSGHKCYAYDLIAFTQPKRIVELGTHKGTSLFAFAQAIKDFNIPCELVGIDSWEGDLNTGSYEGDKTLARVKQIQEEYYANINIRLIRQYFDACIDQFEDGSIDLLHIDGLHTYEGVKHDFITWEKKLTSNGVVLFHDTMVEKENFGVKQFWAEVNHQFASTMEFEHSFGLGVGFKTLRDHIPPMQEAKLKYALESYTRTKYSLYKASYAVRELDEIKASRFWKIKTTLKNLIS